MLEKKNYRIINLNGENPLHKDEENLIFKAMDDEIGKNIKHFERTQTIIKVKI